MNPNFKNREGQENFGKHFFPCYKQHFESLEMLESAF